MIYLTYAFLGNSLIPYLILITIWSTLFYTNIMNKEIRIKNKIGGHDYIRNSSILLPFLTRWRFKMFYFCNSNIVFSLY